MPHHPPDDNPYIGAHDPGEAARLDADEAEAQEELRAALALAPRLPEHPHVLDVGAGSGVLTRTLLAALPGATVTAIDRDERLLAHARGRLPQDVATGRVRFERADAAALPYPARTFDLVVCRCVLMHQPDPLVVAGEMFRVCAVGGVALTIEPDWGAKALYPDAEALGDLLDLARRARPFGFPDLLLGRKLFAILRAAGFVAIRIHPTAFAQTADDLPPPEAAPDSTPREGAGPGRILEQTRGLLRANNLATDAELDALIARLAANRRHPEYLSAGLDFSAAAVKPEPRLP